MSLLINKAIKELLSESAVITSIVGTKLYPIAAPEQETYPFVVFKRSDLKASYTRDGCCENDVNVEITALSDDYVESITLIQAVRDKLDNYRGTVKGIDINHARVQSANESCDGMIYIQELTFDIKTN